MNIIMLIKDLSMISIDVRSNFFYFYGESFTYIRKRSSAKTDSCGTTQFISPAFEKRSSSTTKTFLFERHD